MAKTKMTRKGFISIGCHPDEDRGTHNPAPRASMISEIEAATNAPPTTAPQHTPDECSSLSASIRLSNAKVLSI